MEDKLKAIKEACVKANPDIMKLEFGCELEAKEKRLFYVGYNNQQHCTLLQESQSLLFTDAVKTAKILGRPIRLADVLLAIRNQPIPIPWCACDVYGEFLKYYPHVKEPISSGIRWNLLEDDLTKQSPETIDFLYDLIIPTGTK